MTYSRSTDQEYYYGEFDTEEEAAEIAFNDDSDLETIWVSEVIPTIAHNFVNPRYILECIAESAYDEHECADDWLVDLIKNSDKMAELKKLLGDWIQSNEPPDFWSVGKEKEIRREDFYEK